MKVDLYTDGSSRGNPGPGGYGVILSCGPHYKELSAGYRLTTNNRMELLAVIVGLEALRKPGTEVTVYSDSKYVVEAVEKGWLETWVRLGFKNKKNPDLWLRYREVAARHRVRFVWLKGHVGHPQNEKCDRLAVAAALGDKLLEDTGYSDNLALNASAFFS